MLDSFRRRTNNLAFTFLILLIVAVMAFFGMNMDSPSRGGGGVAAWVNGEPVSRIEYERLKESQTEGIRAQLGGKVDEKLLNSLGIPQRALKQLVQFKLLSQSAKDLGFRVPNEELASHIRSLPYFQVEGRFDASLYQRLPNKGVEERRQRENLRVQKLQKYLQQLVKLSPAELKQKAKLAKIKMNLRYGVVDFSALAAKYNPSPKEITAFLTAENEGSIAQHYETNKDRFKVGAKYNIAQIRVGFPFQADAAKKQEAQEKIREAAKNLTDTNFSEIAKKHSDDEYASSGGARGWVSASDLPPKLGEAVKSLGVGEKTQVVEDLGGYYIVKVVEKREETTRPLEEVSKDIAKEMLTQQHRARFEKETKDSLNALLASGKNIENKLKAIGVKIEETGTFGWDEEYIPKIGNHEGVWESVKGLSPKQRTPKQLAQADNKFYYLSLKSVETPKATPKDELEKTQTQLEAQIENEILTQWMQRLENEADIETKIDFSQPESLPT